MADHGFTIEEKMATRGAHWKYQHLQIARRKFLQNIHNTLMFVIKWNMLLVGQKKVKILNSNIPIKMVGLVDNVMVVICALVNLYNSVVS